MYCNKYFTYEIDEIKLQSYDFKLYKKVNDNVSILYSDQLYFNFTQINDDSNIVLFIKVEYQKIIDINLSDIVQNVDDNNVNADNMSELLNDFNSIKISDPNISESYMYDEYENENENDKYYDFHSGYDSC